MPVSPAVIRKIKHCKGHKETTDKGKCFWQGDELKGNGKWAKHYKKKYGKHPYKHCEFKKGKCWKEWWFVIERCELIIHYWHCDDIEQCDCYSIEEIVEKPASIDGPDQFIYDEPDVLDRLKSDPRCNLIASNLVEGPSSRTIHGLDISRDFWVKDLLFSCNDSSHSDCASLIAQGGIFVSKRCLTENPMGGCDEWEKTYDMGKKEAWVEEVYQFEEGRQTPGLMGESNHLFEPTKRASDFPEMAAFASLFTNLAQEGIEIDSSNNLTNLYPGKAFECRCNPFEQIDCCQRSSNESLIDERMKECTPEEKQLADLREQQRCIYIDSKKDPWTDETTRIFCCFGSKISRMAQEQIRERVSIPWQIANEPQCRGLTQEEIALAGDLSALNLREAEEDFVPRQQQVEDDFQTSIKEMLKSAYVGTDDQ